MSNLRVLHVDLETGQMVAKVGSVGGGSGPGGGSDQYVNVSGDTMEGGLILAGDPVIDSQASTKRYVDLNITAVQSDLTTLAQNISNGISQLVKRSGDTMTGPLRVNSDPAEPMEVANKQYVDNELLNKAILRSGGTMTGHLQLASNPQLSSHAVTRGYVDNAILDIVGGGTYLSLDGGIMGGHIELVSNPTQPNHAVTKEYVDNNATGLSFKNVVRVATTAHIPSLSGFPQVDGVPVGNGDRVLVKNQTDKKLNGIYNVSSSVWARSSDAVADQLPAGSVVNVAEGDANSDTGWILATDGQIVVGLSELTFAKFSQTGSGDQFLDVSGDSMEGALILLGEPTEINEASNKGYIDRKINEIGDKYLQAEPSAVWIVEHNRNTTRIMVQVFDSNNEMVLPSKIKIENPNTVRIEFGEVLVTGSTELLFL